VTAHDAARDCKAEACALGVGLSPDADERKEDIVTALFRNADAFVRHGHDEATVTPFGPDRDGTSARRVLERIRKEVSDDLTHAPAVGADEQRLARQVHAELMLRQLALERSSLLGQHVAQVEVFEL